MKDVCWSCSCSNFWVPWPTNFIFGTQIQVKIICEKVNYQGHWVEIKVTGARKVKGDLKYACRRAEMSALVFGQHWNMFCATAGMSLDDILLDYIACYCLVKCFSVSNDSLILNSTWCMVSVDVDVQLSSVCWLLVRDSSRSVSVIDLDSFL